jgi:hypothetical protein
MHERVLRGEPGDLSMRLPCIIKPFAVTYGEHGFHYLVWADIFESRFYFDLLYYFI